MADNTTRANASGVSEGWAADDVGGVKYPRSKTVIGPDGTAVDIIIPADGASLGAVMPVALELSNGTTGDIMRGNTQGTLLASGARTTNQVGAVQTNYNARGAMVVLNVTVASGTGGIQPRFVGQGTSGGVACYLTAAPTAVIATGAYLYEIYPGSTTAALGGANAVVQRTSGALPRYWRVDITVGDASSYTYELYYNLIV